MKSIHPLVTKAFSIAQRYEIPCIELSKDIAKIMKKPWNFAFYKHLMRYRYKTRKYAKVGRKTIRKQSTIIQPSFEMRKALARWIGENK